MLTIKVLLMKKTHYKTCKTQQDYQRTESGNQQLVIALPIGDFEFGIGVLKIEEWGFRMEGWGKIYMG